jgi:hypothetical protein
MKTLLKATALVAALSLTGSIHALTLSLTDLVTSASVTVADNGAGDLLNAINGKILFAGSVGNWTVNTETGTSGSPNVYPQALSLTSDNTSGGLGTQKLEILLWDNGFIGQGSLAATLAVNNLNIGASVLYEVYKNGTLLTSITAPSLNALTDGAFIGTLTPTDTLLQRVVLTHTQAGNSGYVAGSSVPDGGVTAALLGAGLLLTGIASRRRKLV